MQTLKLVVRASNNCIDLLRFLDKNIMAINQIGARVQIEKIEPDEVDEDMIEMLQRQGITRLPALIAPDGKIFIGRQDIIDLFKKNLVGAERLDRFGPIVPGAAIGGAETGDISDYWMRELYAGRDDKGKLMPRKDEDKPDDDDVGDIQQKMAAYQANIPKHRRPVVEGRPIDRGGDNIDPEPDDDEAGGYYDPPDRPVQPTGRRGAITGGSDTDIDQQMLTAWMQNN